MKDTSPKSRRRVLGLATLVLIGLTGCGGGKSRSDSTSINGGSSDVQTITIAPGASATTTVDGAKIDIPAGAYPEGAQISIQRVSAHPQNVALTPVGEVLEIKGAASSVLPISVTYPNVLSGNAMGFTQVDGVWEPLETQSGSGGARVLLLVTASSKSTRSPLGTLVGLVLYQVLPWDGQTGLVKVAGTGDSIGSKSAIIVHGIMSKAENAVPLAKRLVESGRYANAYAYAYDWRRGVKPAGEDLARRLRALNVPAHSVDLWGHSMGVLVTRYALERERASAHIRDAYLLNGPQKGTSAATVGAVFSVCARILLNDPIASLMIGSTDAAVRDLLPGSEVVRELETPDGDRGNVNYHLFRTIGDEVVPDSSAFAQNTPLPMITSGSIDYGTVTATKGLKHSFLFGTFDQISLLISGDVNVRTGLTAAITPETVIPNATSWPYTFKVTNSSGVPVAITDISIESYDRYGAWVGTQWYDPDAAHLFPTDHVDLSILIRPGETKTFDWRSVVDDDESPLSTLPAALRPQSVVVIARIGNQDDTTTRRVEATANLSWNGDSPTSPITRSHPVGGGNGRVGPSKVRK